MTQSPTLSEVPPTVAAKCRYFGTCGGCSLQTVSIEDQRLQKKDQLQEILTETGDLRPETFLPPLTGEAWGYRSRASLSARFMTKQGRSFVGFREKRGGYVTDMTSCEILPERVSNLLSPLRELIGRLSIPRQIPQINVALGDDVDGFVIRHLGCFSELDLTTLQQFEKQHSIRIYLQPAGPSSIQPLDPQNSLELEYTLPEFGLGFLFHPGEFTQVNPEINRLMVSEAMRMLDPRPGETVLDLFCGVGNFSLPIAARGASVMGLEGNRTQVDYALRNAERNSLSHLTRFETENLETFSAERAEGFDKMVIDPPRSGALAVVQNLPADGPRKILYIACGPQSFARDAAILMREKGYTFKSCRLIDMFPQTAHMEVMSLFEK